MSTKWNYSGDINVEYGGFWWREDGADDYVLAVRLTPCSDAGGPNNLFDIETGSIYLPKEEEKRKRALACCGYPASTERALLVEAFMAYAGIDRDCEIVVRVGKQEDMRNKRYGWNPTPDKVLRSNASLRRYVEREVLD